MAESNGDAETPEKMTDSLGAQPSPTATDSQRPPPNTTESTWSSNDVTISPPAMSLQPVTVPDGEQYPTMGTAGETVTLYGNWKCPYTREFVRGQLPGLVEDFVRPGDVSLQFRSVAYRSGDPFLGADAPRSTRAGLAVWETDPEAFWTYFTYVFANQPQERYQWGTPELLTRFAGTAGVDDPGAVRTAATGAAYESRLRQTVESATRRDIWSVPRVASDGQVTAPTRDAASTREQLERAADS